MHRTNTLTIVAAGLLLSTLTLEGRSFVVNFSHTQHLKLHSLDNSSLLYPLDPGTDHYATGYADPNFGIWTICHGRYEVRPSFLFHLRLIEEHSLSLLSIWSPESPVPDLVIAFGMTRPRICQMHL